MSNPFKDFPDNLRPEDVRIDIWNTWTGCPKIRMTHGPTGLVSECTTERLAFRARQVALQDLSEKVKNVLP